MYFGKITQKVLVHLEGLQSNCPRPPLTPPHPRHHFLRLASAESGPH